jgi:hypothetical protein
MKQFASCILGAFLAALPFAASAQLSEAEQQGIDDALLVSGLRRADFSYSRIPFAKPVMLPLVETGLMRPFDAAGQLMPLHQSAKDGPAATIKRGLFEVLGVEAKPLPPVTPPVFLDAPPILREAVVKLSAALTQSDAEIRASLVGLTPAEQRILIEGLPRLAVQQPSVSFEFVKSTMPTEAALHALLVKVNVNRILAAGQLLSETVRAEVENLKKFTGDVPAPMRVRVADKLVEIRGRGSDVISSSDARLVIDLGGEDTYTGRVGAGVGYSSVVIDLGGDDSAKSRDLTLGAGLLGVGIAWFEGGDDRLVTGSMTLGSGVAGLGAFIKSGGRDRYDSKTLSQGFGFAGMGLMMDLSGSDIYDVQLFGQGAARYQGLGWLVDHEGRDIYRAGGLFTAAPLVPTGTYSFSQGFGMGYREDSGGRPGGVGLLTDFAGEDSYLAGVYSQAASYWLAVGSIFDAAGNDVYSAHYYSQASAMHLCGSYLFDLAGDDFYAVKVGAAHAIGHDYGNAFLLDRAGDDSYASRDSNPGVGTANGSAVFIDGGGIDRYGGPSGAANPSRGGISLSVFVDLGGKDLYRTGLADGEATARPLIGSALDVPDPVIAPAAPGAAVQAGPTPGSVPVAPDAELVKIYQKAIQWGVGSAQAEVTENVNKLVSMGLPAFDWMLRTQLANAQRLELRAFVAVASALGDQAGQVMVKKAEGATTTELSNLLRIAADARVAAFAPALPNLIGKPETRSAAINVAASLKSKESVPAILEAAKVGGMTMRVSMTALNAIGDAGGLPLALALAAGDDPHARYAAQSLLKQHPAASFEAAKELMAEAEEFRARVGIELAGAVGTAEALNLIGTFLSDPRSGLRIAALTQLAGRCPEPFRAAMNELRSDPVVPVAAVAKRLLPAAP